MENTVEQIRKRYEHYETVKPNTAVADIRALLEEIEMLKRCLEEYWNGNYDCS